MTRRQRAARAVLAASVASGLLWTLYRTTDATEGLGAVYFPWGSWAFLVAVVWTGYCLIRILFPESSRERHLRREWAAREEEAALALIRQVKHDLAKNGRAEDLLKVLDIEQEYRHRHQVVDRLNAISVLLGVGVLGSAMHHNQGEGSN